MVHALPKGDDRDEISMPKLTVLPALRSTTASTVKHALRFRLWTP